MIVKTVNDLNRMLDDQPLLKKLKDIGEIFNNINNLFTSYVEFEIQLYFSIDKYNKCGEWHKVKITILDEQKQFCTNLYMLNKIASLLKPVIEKVDEIKVVSEDSIIYIKNE